MSHLEITPWGTDHDVRQRVRRFLRTVLPKKGRNILREFATLFAIIHFYKNWRVMLRRYGYLRSWGVLSLNGRLQEIRFRDGTRFMIRDRTADIETIHEIYARKPYTPWRNFLPGDARVIVDVGAHIGTFAIHAARRVTRATVFAFEPEPTNFSLLKKNVSLNALRNITPLQCAVADRTGTVTLYLSSTRNIEHTIRPGSGHGILVNTVSLGDFFTQHHLRQCDFLKMDCEGAEFPILFSAPPTILQRIRRIAIEYHGPQIAELSSFLQDQGYVVVTRPALTPFLGMLYAARP